MTSARVAGVASVTTGPWSLAGRVPSWETARQAVRLGGCRRRAMAVTTIDDVARAAAVDVPSALPATGVAAESVLAALDELAADDLDWRNGRGFSLVYDSPENHRVLVRDVASRFLDENALSHSAFPSAARCEAGVLAMVASVLAPSTK